MKKRKLNFSLLNKVSPLTYEGVIYSTVVENYSTIVSVSLYYNGSNGNWTVFYNPGPGTGIPVTGSWTTTPATQYEYRITNVTINSREPVTLEPIPSSPYPTSWLPISPISITQLCSCNIPPPPIGLTYNLDAVWNIQVRKVGTTTPVVASTIRLTGSSSNTLGYDGYDYSTFSAGPSGATILKYSNAGTWEVTSAPSGAPVVYDGPSSGTWTTTPGVSYEFRILSVSGVLITGTSSTSPVSGPSGWQAINTTSKTICSVSASDTIDSLPATASATFTIQVREVGTTTPVATSTISLTAESTD